MANYSFRLLVFVFLLIPFIGMAAARSQTGSHVKLPEADISAYPWSAIGKLNNSVGGSCTGAIIEQDLALTAAHCIFNRRTGRFLPPSSLHLLLGYRRGDYVVHARVAAYTLGPGYDPGRELPTISSDWALLKLTEPLPIAIRPLPIVDQIPPAGTRLMIGSYERARPYIMTLDDNCQLLGTLPQPSVFEHDCQVGQGSSGAPLLTTDPRTPAIVGMQVAIRRLNRTAIMLALSAPSITINESH
jgi:protease YdgD